MKMEFERHPGGRGGGRIPVLYLRFDINFCSLPPVPVPPRFLFRATAPTALYGISPPNYTFMELEIYQLAGRWRGLFEQERVLYKCDFVTD